MFTWQVLSDDELQQVRRASEAVLERTGCLLKDEQALAACRRAGAVVDDVSGRVRLPRTLLQELIDLAPRSYRVGGLDGIDREVGAGRPWGVAIVTDPWIIDYPSQEPRRPRLDDLRRNTLIAQQLPQVMAVSCMDFPASDVPGPHSNLRALEAHLLHHAKHSLVCAASVESMGRWLKIAEILAGGVRSPQAPLLTLAVASLSPLAVTETNVELIRVACRHGFPIVPTVCPTAGMTSPYSLAGTLVQAHAEALFLLALVQIHRPGHPFLYALGPATAELRKGANLYYTLDKVLWKSAHLQLAGTYGLPAGAECGGSLVHRFDQQSGLEGFLFMLSAVASGADVLAGFGSTFNAVGHSTEMMLIQDAYLEAAQFLVRGIRCDAEHLAVEAIDRCGPGGNYLTDELTLKYLRGGEFFAQELFDQAADSTLSQSLAQRAHAKAAAMLAEAQSPVPHEVQEQLRKFFHDEARR